MGRQGKRLPGSGSGDDLVIVPILDDSVFLFFCKTRFSRSNIPKQCRAFLSLTPYELCVVVREMGFDGYTLGLKLFDTLSVTVTEKRELSLFHKRL